MPSTGQVGSRSPPLVLAPALVALALGGGCGDQGPPEATTIEISPREQVLQDAGDTLRLTATVRDRNGEAMPWVPVTWSVRDSFVVQLSEDGLVTAEEPGEALVQAEAAAVRAHATVTVELGQRAVLHKIYRVMGGDDWKRNTHWKTDAPLNAWIGVRTDFEGNVTRLALNHNNLTGSIPPELGSLKSLLDLQIFSNPATGSIPPELGNLENIRKMVVASGQFTGPIPPELANLPNLRYLSLFSNQLTGPIPPELGTHRPV